MTARSRIADLEVEVILSRRKKCARDRVVISRRIVFSLGRAERSECRPHSQLFNFLQTTSFDMTGRRAATIVPQTDMRETRGQGDDDRERTRAVHRVLFEM